ncbi:type VI secretion system amidase effector protein Tae4 [Photobacterium alginatilyticum]|uniref:type VI secretion system amidase effector protein Tae4 n=1 Tax=Photobacterium alginatilyticum TaxID=1775171 RepID=UPI004067FDDD
MIRFKNLWEEHPTITGDKTPCSTDGKPNFSDQCAIRLGAALAASGVDTRKLVSKARHCWFHDISEGHVLAAEELARGLARQPLKGVGKVQKIDPNNFARALSGKTGIIFFKDFWARDNELFRNRTGDHIDLWNGSRLSDWRTWFMISSVFNAGSNYAKSKEIWFWSVK